MVPAAGRWLQAAAERLNSFSWARFLEPLLRGSWKQVGRWVGVEARCQARCLIL